MMSATANTENYSYLAALNKEQREAVETLDGPALVLAGAGTGKTRALTTRIAHLIHTGKAFPGQVLAVTFTNKAAMEMKERVESLLGEPLPTHTSRTATGMWLGTFHSICARMLRRHAERLGFPQDFTILDDDDQIRLLKQILVDANIDPKKFPAKMLQAIIQRWKDKGLTPEKAAQNAGHEEQQPLMLYGRYQQRMKTIGAMDFGDLLLHTLTLFQEHQDVLQEYAQRFRYILVDEYQDTNVAQYLWLRLLALGHHNLCCVGDDDQSIYGWRGAEVGNILKFEQDFPEAKVIRLERNYRSTGHILGAASGLIAKNSSRLGKTLWTDDADGEFVRIKSCWDDEEEARFVGEEVEAFQRDKISLEEMAILVRAGYQTRAFEERFITLGIPYRVIGGLRFYERMEIRDAVAYLRAIAQPNDDLALERIINTPKRGIGKSTLEKLHHFARDNNVSLYEAVNVGIGLEVRHPEPQAKDLSSQTIEDSSVTMFPQNDGMAVPAFISGKAAKTLAELFTQFDKWRSLASDMPSSELADLVMEESGYRAMWQADKSPEANGRLENLKELLRALEDFPTLGEFLEHVGLVTQGDEAGGASEMVSFMTLHGAKGLEYQVVFLTGWEEGLFPSQRSMDEKGTAGLEEERRLAYVGITRARKFCTISHTGNRRIYGQWQSAIPSRFVSELPGEHIENMDGPLHYRSKGPTPFQRGVEGVFKSMEESASQGFTPSPKSLRSLPSPRGEGDAPASGEGQYTKGARVFHQKFGNGVILAVDGDALTIAFKHAGKKKVMSDYIELA